MCVHSVVSDSATPGTGAHPAPPWDFPGKNTGVRCNFLLQIEIAYHLRPLEGGWFRLAVHRSALSTRKRRNQESDHRCEDN